MSGNLHVAVHFSDHNSLLNPSIDSCIVYMTGSTNIIIYTMQYLYAIVHVIVLATLLCYLHHFMKGDMMFLLRVTSMNMLYT